MSQEAAGALATAKPVVFISHSSKDRVVADRVCDLVEAAGIRCWIAPRDILPGADWGLSILQAIKTCTVMVLVFSGHTNTSPQIRREVELAVDQGLVLIPMRIEDIKPTGPLEYFLRAPQWMDAFSEPFDSHVHYLVRVLRNIVSTPGVGSTTAPPSSKVPAPSQAPDQPPAAQPPAAQFDPALLQALQPRLARHVGPIAQRLIAHAARRCADYHALCVAVAEHIPDPVERRAFRDEVLCPPLPASHQAQAHVAETIIAHAVRELTHALGPVARVLVMRAHEHCATTDELWECLAAQIPVASDRAAFLGAKPRH